ncbi:MAG: hypothetical protein MZV70_01320 [Desulfobacterales bacterium]|nr:hypothetical protein [Desulfobacterales bacterium]
MYLGLIIGHNRLSRSSRKRGLKNDPRRQIPAAGRPAHPAAAPQGRPGAGRAHHHPAHRGPLRGQPGSRPAGAPGRACATARHWSFS